MSLRTTLLYSALCATLAACGGAGSGGGMTDPVTTTAVTPTPTPTPTSAAQNFNTAEYRRSNGLDTINAIAAYEAGGTGQGVIIGMVDSGIDIDNSEFAGRIHPSSTNTANPGDSFQDEDGHGTFTASVAAGAKDDIGTHGVAFDAQILALRTDDAGSCASDDGCSHFDIDIAQAIDVASSVGAQISNVSLGGGGASFSMRAAVDRATEDGMIIVISAGNDGQSSPDDFALLAASNNANGRMLIAGYVDENNVIDENSNRAGSAADVFVVAPGTSIRATGLDGDEFFVSGSSFSAPHVSGAIAVLYELFPDLTADEMIELITSTATDLGEPGVDEIYGHGLINLEEAIQPQGTLMASITNAETTTTAPLNASLQSPSAFGDALSTGLTGMTVTSTDRFRRAYDVNLAPFAQAQQPQVGLQGILNTRQHFAHSALGSHSGHFTAQLSLRQDMPLPADVLASFSGAFADRADQRDMSGRVHVTAGQLSLQSSFGLRAQSPLSDGPERSLISLRDSDASSYGLSDAPSDGTVSAQYPLTSTVHVALQTNWSRQTHQNAFAQVDESTLRQTVLSLRYQISPNSSAAISLGAIDETGQIFGAASDQGALSLGSGARTLYAEASARRWIDDETYIYASAAYGSARIDTTNQASLLLADTQLGVSSWQLGARRRSAFSPRDTIAFTLSQPQRIESGSAVISGLMETPETRFSLSPTGRQIDAEAAYEIAIKNWGNISANLLARRDLGHVAGQHDVASFIRFTSGF